LVRVEACEVTRAARGWIFTPGIDDAESECDLDSTDVDFVIANNGDDSVLNNEITALCKQLTARMDGQTPFEGSPNIASLTVQTS